METSTSNIPTESTQKKPVKATKKPNKQPNVKIVSPEKQQEVLFQIKDRVGKEKHVYDLQIALLEPNITPEFFLKCCEWFQPLHHDDVTHERSIAGSCGYPLCSNEVKRISKKQSYSIRNYQLYETGILERYCSLKCMHSSNFIRSQLDSSPVYLRDPKTRPISIRLPEELSAALSETNSNPSTSFPASLPIIEHNISTFGEVQSNNTTISPPSTIITSALKEDSNSSEKHKELEEEEKHESKVPKPPQPSITLEAFGISPFGIMHKTLSSWCGFQTLEYLLSKTQSTSSTSSMRAPPQSPLQIRKQILIENVET